MKKILIVITIMIIAIVGLAVFLLGRVGIDIKVINQTNEEIPEMYLTYENINSDIKIPPLAPGETYKLNLNTIKNSTEDFVEGALLLKYIDNFGSLNTEYVIGYFEKGYSGNAVIKIKSIDANGKLEIEIEDNPKIK
ncbi:hypothetical protein ACFVSW_21170 [Neobacillus sp. NPDC058068]|uniref:hypothetical protein n=1 Tax=Neobacillus sp. NPDC058068 TaxID=3346325 RepID=UPI0036DC86ED